MSSNDFFSTKFSRRDVLKMGGLSALALPAVTSLGRIGGNTLLASTEQYGGFLVKTRANGTSYQVKDSSYSRFDARNVIFNRMVWDKTLQAKIGPKEHAPDQWIADKKPGFAREDFALVRAAWTVASTFGTNAAQANDHGGLLSVEPLPPSDPFSAGWLDYAKPWDHGDLSNADITKMVKKAALFYGASLVGIAPLDQRWIFSGTLGNTGKPHAIEITDAATKPAYAKDGTLQIPESMHWVIVMAFEMDPDAVKCYPTQIGAAGASNGYSRMTFAASCLAQFVRGLGYNAIPCGNMTGLSIPEAVDAGLGELGRNGLLITPKYGPRVRLAKVIVDLPLIVDQPISFGVSEFCDVCGKCAEECPSKAIDKGSRTWEGTTISNNPGVLKWYIDPEKCFGEWASLGFSDCGTCIRVCPFNKPEGWLHEATRILIGADTGSVDKLLLHLDSASGYGKEHDPDKFWDEDHFIHIK